MDPNVAAFLASWPWAPWTTIACALTIIIYARGWRALRRRGSDEFGRPQLWAFCGGVTAVWLALCSPLEPFADLLLSVHMAQHLLLMLVAPALIWLGAPQLPLMHGLPEEVLECWLLPVVQSRVIDRAAQFLLHPVMAWTSATILVWLWHVPGFYERALQSSTWHALEHICFLGSGLLFWWPVVQPYPSRPVWPRVAMLPYLFLAAVQATILCAFLSFADRVLYPHYSTVPRIAGLSALADQEIAGAMMWLAGLVAYLLPMVVLGHRLLYRSPAERKLRSAHAGPSAVERRIGIDLLRMPLVGKVLRSVQVRRVLQLGCVIVAIAIALDGFTGPQTAPLNLAGVVPWIHWRGLVVLGLLGLGNVFCLACPFTLPSNVARRWFVPRWEWPARWRSKWLALAGLALFFWAYEAFDLWASPWWTAWIIVGYFALALVIDMAFRGAAFCKYVCPVGQFQFVQSLLSPWEVRVRDPQPCVTCRTRDCLKGNETGPGCELQLFVPRKLGNMDCTFCLDCVRACPVANVGVMATTPGAAIAAGARPDSAPPRHDLAVLMLFLAFAALANAAGMIGPVLRANDVLAERLRLPLPLVETALVVVTMVLLPIAAVTAAAALSRAGARSEEPLSRISARYAAAFVPLGAAMWLAHYGFHLVTGITAIIPPLARFFSQWGLPVTFSAAQVRQCCAVEPPGWLVPTEIAALQCGMLISLYLLYRISTSKVGESPRALAALFPWATLVVLMFAGGSWILLQPMEMRGTLAEDTIVALRGN